MADSQAVAQVAALMKIQAAVSNTVISNEDALKKARQFLEQASIFNQTPGTTCDL